MINIHASILFIHMRTVEISLNPSDLLKYLKNQLIFLYIVHVDVLNSSYHLISCISPRLAII